MSHLACRSRSRTATIAATAAALLAVALPSAASADSRASVPSPKQLSAARPAPAAASAPGRPPRALVKRLRTHSRNGADSLGHRRSHLRSSSVVWTYFSGAWQSQAGFNVYSRWSWALVGGEYFYRNELLYCPTAALSSCSVFRIYVMVYRNGQWSRWVHTGGQWHALP
jgi:hypothetical protein